MKLLLLQTNIIWRSPRENMERAAGLIADAVTAGSKPDLIVLPEMFTTGFDMEPGGDVQAGPEALEWMRAQARQYDAAVAGSVAWSEEGGIYNRFLFVRPDGSHDHYDKRHLFTFAGEDERYAAGDRRVVVQWRGVRILLQVCYDLRFPVFARNRGDYDMILYTANWPQSRIRVWETLLRARAMENACYVAGVNRAGDDPAQHYPGASAVVDYKGGDVAVAGDGETPLSAVVELEPLAEFRRKFPVLGDADAFRLEEVR